MLDEAVPEGPVVLVGHSMGGMTIVALAEEHPELFGDRVVGVGLIATTAGGVDPHRDRAAAAALDRRRPVRVTGSSRRWRAGTAPSTGSARSGARWRWSRPTSWRSATPYRPAYVEFVDEMLSATPFGVVADFFPTFGTLEKFETVHAMSSVPTAIICGTRDKLTPIEHSRKLHELIEGSTLLECEGAGHMVMLERHDQVNAELDQLLAAAGDLVDQR